MVVQQGRLKEKDKLSRDELLEAVRFGADKIFKSKDSSITDDDIDLIIESGAKKTQELNEKFKAAEKGDMLDFKLDGGLSAQTFEGVDYSKQDLALAKAAQAQAELFSILDIGKRERRTVANYNENELFRSQVVMQHVERKKKKETVKLPAYLRLPRMEEWQMFDRATLKAIQEEEEAAFLALPEDVQKLAKKKSNDSTKDMSGVDAETVNLSLDENSLVDSKVVLGNLPPLLSEEKQLEKERLLSEGFTNWDKGHYLAFVKASGTFGRSNFPKIAMEVGKSQNDVEVYAAAFWDVNIGKKRISENEYDRQVKSVERGEKRQSEVKSLERATSTFLSLFDDPWRSLEFTHVSCKDKLFSIEEDRYLLCWAHKVRQLRICSDCVEYYYFSHFILFSVWIRTMGSSQIRNPSKS
jgi:SWI/SNF-related matrix-associated actin-dependent regulator of chromatin subfamily A member 5